MEAQLELPYRILVGLEVGYMPRAYADTINSVCTGFGWYNGQTASLISAAIGDALALRPSIGFRPFPREGFEVVVGYTLAVLGGGLSSAEIIQSASGVLSDICLGNVDQQHASQREHARASQCRDRSIY